MKIHIEMVENNTFKVKCPSLAFRKTPTSFDIRLDWYKVLYTYVKYTQTQLQFLNDNAVVTLWDTVQQNGSSWDPDIKKQKQK